MQKFFLSFDGVGTGGFHALPQMGHGSVWVSNVLNSHYDNCNIFSDVKELLIIETAKPEGSKPLVYYQYLRYKGVSDAAGRKPSVFGVNIATDTFCLDTDLMYSLCKDIFETCVIGGNVLAQGADGSLTWKCNNFATSGLDVREIEDNKLGKVLGSYLTVGFIKDCSIDGWQVSPYLSKNNENQLLVRLNPLDATPEQVAGLVKAGKKVAISAEFPLQSVKKQIADAQAATQKALNEAAALSSQNATMSTTISTQKKDIDKLRKELSEAGASGSKKERQLKDQIGRLQQELKAKEDAHRAELRKFQAQGNVSCQQQLDRISANLNNIAASSKAAPQPKGFTPSTIDMAVGALAALLVIACGFFLGRCTAPEGGKDSDKEKDQTEQTDTTAQQNQEKLDQFYNIMLETKIPGSGQVTNTGDDQYDMDEEKIDRDEKEVDMAKENNRDNTQSEN